MCVQLYVHKWQSQGKQHLKSLQAMRINMQLQLAKCWQDFASPSTQNPHTEHSYAANCANIDKKYIQNSSFVIIVMQPQDAASGSCFYCCICVLLQRPHKSSTFTETFALSSESGPGLVSAKPVLASACCCNSRPHGHSFIQEGAGAADSHWYIGCGGVFNVCESPLGNDYMHAPVACSHCSC